MSINILGILQADEVRPEWQAEFGKYPAMFERLFRRVAPDLQFKIFDVRSGEHPQPLEACDGYIITGSKSGVYEDLDWIKKLLDLIRAISARGVPQAGICFGHQALTQAFHGKVIKAEQGWGVGVHQYQTNEDLVAIRSGDTISMLATHQDQAVERPPDEDVRVLAQSAFCPIASLISHKKRFLSFQGHPEFTKTYALKLLTSRLDELDESTAVSARLSMQENTDEEAVARSILRFIEQHQRKQNN